MCIYICVYICIYSQIYIYIYTLLHMYIHMYTRLVYNTSPGYNRPPLWRELRVLLPLCCLAILVPGATETAMPVNGIPIGLCVVCLVWYLFVCFYPIKWQFANGNNHFQTRQYVYIVDRGSIHGVKHFSVFPSDINCAKACFLWRQEHKGNQHMTFDRIQRKGNKTVRHWCLWFWVNYHISQPELRP